MYEEEKEDEEEQEERMQEDSESGEGSNDMEQNIKHELGRDEKEWTLVGPGDGNDAKEVGNTKVTKKAEENNEQRVGVVKVSRYRNRRADDVNNGSGARSADRKAEDDSKGVCVSFKGAGVTDGVQMTCDDGSDNWGWGNQLGPMASEEEAVVAERRQVTSDVAASWRPEPSRWASGQSGVKLRFETPAPSNAVSTVSTVAKIAGPQTGSVKGEDKKLRVEPTEVSTAVITKEEARASAKIETDFSGNKNEDLGERGYIYFRGTPSPTAETSGRGGTPIPGGNDGSSRRAWGQGSGSSVVHADVDVINRKNDGVRGAKVTASGDGHDVAAISQNARDGFVLARPARFRPSGCFVRLQGTGPESFLPVEHIEPYTKATTTSIRERVQAAGGRLLIRDIGDNLVTMLSESDLAKRGKELEARRRHIEEGIAVLRDSFDTKKWLSGGVSAVQDGGAYVSVIEGKDAFVPINEIPDCHLVHDRVDVDENESAKPPNRSGSARPGLQLGQLVEFRVLRYSWQTDSFVASMLSYDESVAKRRAAQKSQEPPKSRSLQVTAGDTGERSPQLVASPPKDPPRQDKALARLAAKGFSVLDDSSAKQLNDWIRQNAEAKRAQAKGGSSKAGPKSTDRKFIVSVAKGMNVKVIGQLTMPSKASEKELKDAAVELASKEGELKSGGDHKGVTVFKNTVTVKA
eukprot:TRINITY_DN1646_c0_g1_i2.p1 TRINITY_DN1646_c0_g1~~TRINITY_DN1646_c0_g1_i2.p1  ORF type:complete len:690 (+),score=127.58 TRINITY_DN1646_c0_g1_i2:547-2616(+)